MAALFNVFIKHPSYIDRINVKLSFQDTDICILMKLPYC